MHLSKRGVGQRTEGDAHAAQNALLHSGQMPSFRSDTVDAEPSKADARVGLLQPSNPHDALFDHVVVVVPDWPSSDSPGLPGHRCFSIAIWSRQKNSWHEHSMGSKSRTLQEATAQCLPTTRSMVAGSRDSVTRMSLLFGSAKPHLVSVQYSEVTNSTDDVHLDQKSWSILVSAGNSAPDGRIAIALEPLLLKGLQPDSSDIQSIISWARLDSEVG